MEPPPRFTTLPSWPTMLSSDGAYHIPKEDFVQLFILIQTLTDYIDTQYKLCNKEF